MLPGSRGRVDLGGWVSVLTSQWTLFALTDNVANSLEMNGPCGEQVTWGLETMESVTASFRVLLLSYRSSGLRALRLQLLRYLVINFESSGGVCWSSLYREQSHGGGRGRRNDVLRNWGVKDTRARDGKRTVGRGWLWDQPSSLK